MISTIAAWSNAETLHLQKPTARLCTSDWCNHTFFRLRNTRPELNIKAEVSIQKPAWLPPCCQAGPAFAGARPRWCMGAPQTRARGTVTTFPFHQRFFPIVSKICDGQLSFYCERIALNRTFCREMIQNGPKNTFLTAKPRWSRMTRRMAARRSIFWPGDLAPTRFLMLANFLSGLGAAPGQWERWPGHSIPGQPIRSELGRGWRAN